MRLTPAGDVPVQEVVLRLRDKAVNYDESEVRGSTWHFDHHRFALGTDEPGRPEKGSLWWHACREVGAYSFTPAALLRAHYVRDEPLLGRNLLLVGRFAFARFLMGVRITETAFDEDGVRYCWGWSYETLQGHIERGRVDYRVVKDLASGAVTLEVNSYNQVNPRAHPFIRLGWSLFGRRAQHRFYTAVGENLRALAERARDTGESPAVSGDGLVEVPRQTGREPFWAVAVLDGADDSDGKRG
ncbi:hypothetical protein BBK82_42585 [Lentzea guizhouensis]|uniref:DUF1990 domain-containing protein n=1 Tax=Lentzea guizhouensis TaxID=1586287 RepID=A0A1B2HV83_9PSEU|nr:DUF1990 family protein [Lentzea guizhouensis]ANZ41649.1 hypothetical protein BBK82_42585 [Lentzea guizhouensis]